MTCLYFLWWLERWKLNHMYTTSKTRLKNAVYSERENYKLRFWECADFLIYIIQNFILLIVTRFTKNKTNWSKIMWLD